MRYTISSPETERRLATVDHLESRGESAWTVALVDEKGGERKTALSDGLRVSLGRDQLELYDSKTGARHVFPVSGPAADGAVSISTALGTFRLLPSRGVVAEAAGGAGSGARSIKSSMPGKVLKLLCKPGDRIEAGQPLLIIEAMKMENEIRSPQAGIVEEIPVQPGQSIQTGELLAKIGKGE